MNWMNMEDSKHPDDHQHNPGGVEFGLVFIALFCFRQAFMFSLKLYIAEDDFKTPGPPASTS